jgi:uncharacterized membrane protein HdeD (DUF308 family)
LANEEEAIMPAGLPMNAETLRKYSTWFMIYGIVLIVLGVLAIAMPGIATLATAFLVGWLLIIGGIFGLIAVFAAGTSAAGFWWHLLTAILYLVAGIMIFVSPVAGVLTLTILLAAYMFAGGVMRIVISLGYRRDIPKAWGWLLFSGIVDIALGLLIISGFPGTAAWVLGLLVGINFVFMGWAIVMTAYACRTMVQEAKA